MRKVIKITNEPTFNIGIESYVLDCDVDEQSYSVAPNLEKAKSFTDESLDKVFQFINSRFPKADVRIVEVD